MSQLELDLHIPGDRMEIQVSKLSRIEVIDHSVNGEGRVYSKWDVSVSLSVQDDGKTLKVFVKNKPLKEVA